MGALTTHANSAKIFIIPLLFLFTVFLFVQSGIIFTFTTIRQLEPESSTLLARKEQPVAHPQLPLPFQSFKLNFNKRIQKASKRVQYVPKEFQLKTALWRPSNPANPDLPIVLDEFYEDRGIAQTKWMKDVAKSDIFKQLKPKRIMIEDNFPAVHDGSKLKCPGLEAWESKCTLKLEKGTIGSKNFPDDINEFDAHFGFRFWYPQFERKLPENSKVKQFLLTFEPPPLTGKIDLSLNNAFLVTYWRGADIPIPYVAKFRVRENWNQSLHEDRTNYAKGKTKLAAIVVSNCKPNNNRLGYVKELQRYISVDIYGKCGTRNCTEPCFENLGKEYKFYLSFENSNCRDYMTEKFWRNALYNNMVPVVLGADKRDYLYVAPANSFIHVEDFESPAGLAAFLKKIDRNDTLYNAYFHWKSQGYYQVSRTDTMCRVCALLFMTDYILPPIWPKNSTWESANVCLPKGRWYWHRPNRYLSTSTQYLKKNTC